MPDVKVKFDIDGEKRSYVYGGTVVDSGQFNVGDDIDSSVLIDSAARRVIVTANKSCHLRVMCGGNQLNEDVVANTFPVGDCVPALPSGVLNDGGIYFASQNSAYDITTGTHPDFIIENALGMLGFSESTQEFTSSFSGADTEYIWALRQTLGRVLSVHIPNGMSVIAITANMRNNNPVFVQYVGLNTEE